MTSPLFQSTVDAIAPIIKSSERLGALKAQLDIIEDLSKMIDQQRTAEELILIGTIINRIEKNNGLPITNLGARIPSPDALDD